MFINFDSCEFTLKQEREPFIFIWLQQSHAHTTENSLPLGCTDSLLCNITISVHYSLSFCSAYAHPAVPDLAAEPQFSVWRSLSDFFLSFCVLDTGFQFLDHTVKVLHLSLSGFDAFPRPQEPRLRLSQKVTSFAYCLWRQKAFQWLLSCCTFYTASCYSKL